MAAGKFARLVLVLPFTASLVLPAVALDRGEENHASKGRAIAERLCAKCHAIGKSGESALQAAPPFRDFVKRWPLAYLEESLAEGIVTGHPDMPAFVFEPEDIAHLIEYLATLSDPDS